MKPQIEDRLLLFLGCVVVSTKRNHQAIDLVGDQGSQPRAEVMPRPDVLDFDGFVLRRGAANSRAPVGRRARGLIPRGRLKSRGFDFQRGTRGVKKKGAAVLCVQIFGLVGACCGLGKMVLAAVGMREETAREFFGARPACQALSWWFITSIGDT